MSLWHGRRRLVNRFRLILTPFFQFAGLPFTQVLSERDVQDAADAEAVAFGNHDGDVYTPALTLWAFLWQVLHKDRGSSCAAAVARVITLLATLGRKPCFSDTGAYCRPACPRDAGRARAKLSEPMLDRLITTVARRLESDVPGDWLWCGRRVKLVDGSTVSMPDTPANQQVYPQPRSQKPGLGFPIARIVVVLSLATRAMHGVALGPYHGKETGETALVRSLLDQFDQGDVLLADRFHGSYFALAMAQQRGVDSVVRLHQRRRSDFRCGRRLGKGDHLVQWAKPACASHADRPAKPAWMDEATYASMADMLTVREVQVQVEQPGFRVDRFVVVTTLTDAQRYPAARIAELYRLRWQAELDIRSIKEAMGMDILRCKTPQMVRKEILAHCLAYNLLCKILAQAALLHEQLPRELSFSGALHAVQAAWSGLMSLDAAMDRKIARAHLRSIASQRIGHRPGRIEPRAVKRRPKPHKLLNKPRAEARADIMARTAKQR